MEQVLNNLSFDDVFEKITETRYITLYKGKIGKSDIAYIQSFSKSKPDKKAYYIPEYVFYKVKEYYKLKDQYKTLIMDKYDHLEAYNIIKTLFGPFIADKFRVYDPKNRSDCTDYTLYRGSGYHGIDSVVFIECTENTKRTDFTKNELEILKDVKSKIAENKVINNLCKSTVEAICKKYGIELRDKEYFYFSGRGDINKFIFEALKVTVFKELEENGYKIDNNLKKIHNRGKLNENSILFSLNDLRLSKDITNA